MTLSWLSDKNKRRAWVTDRELVRKLHDFERRAIHSRDAAAEALEVWSLIRNELLGHELLSNWWFVAAADAVEPTLLDQVEGWYAAPPNVRADVVGTINEWMQHIAEQWDLELTRDLE